ncbi:uncharacterized protein LOC141877981 [Acropora palmata]|uniref:uncharacterized protein LOC141877981 n=1 Tax=Acropora palmata TaxID=6131 RepID=UPI003DA09192
MCELRHQPLTLEIGPFCKVMASSKSFFDDVKKELECSVCQEQFSDVREPKILKCLHTFCKTCLTAWLSQQQCEGELSCPTCRQITQCFANDIDKLPSNLFCKQLVEIVEAYSGRIGDEDSPHCGICDEKKALKFYCVQCNAFLCEECAGVHEKGKVFKGHNIKEISNFNSNDVQKYVRRANVCQKHDDEVRYYCEKCNICICRDCALLEHREHNIISLDRGLDLKKSDITKRIQEVEDVGRRLQVQKENLEIEKTRFDSSVDQSTLKIHRVVEHRINVIRRHEEAMTKELLKRKESFENEFSAKITDVNEKLTDIKSSLEFGRDILERNNLPEILNVEETLGRRFEDFSSSAGFNGPIELNAPAVKYVAADMLLSENELGKLIDAEISTGQDKGMIESQLRGDFSRQGEPYNEIEDEADQVDNVDVAQTRLTDEAIKRPSKLRSKPRPRSNGISCHKALRRKGNVARRSKAFTDERTDGNTEEECPICLNSFSNPHSLNCKHTSCSDCLQQALDVSNKCPVCQEPHGNQPPGEMTSETNGISLPGYEGHGSIIINYRFPPGTQGKEHPNPGQYYEGTSRRAYLPDTREGREVLQLLRRAFDARLVFTVGTSTTTGLSNQITWNDIHHKTAIHGGPYAYGYPDPDYLRRVKEELAAKGIK